MRAWQHPIASRPPRPTGPEAQLWSAPTLPRQAARGRSPGLQSLSDEDVVLLGRLKDRRSAAEDVYRALRRAEQAANAAAQVRVVAAAAAAATCSMPLPGPLAAICATSTAVAERRGESDMIERCANRQLSSSPRLTTGPL